jgi:hypothetical protein
MVVAEMIETPLMDELQIPAINRLFHRGMVNSGTRFIPQSYRTSAQLAFARRFTLAVRPPGDVNALRLRGAVTLAPGIHLAACNSMNGDKILPTPEAQTGASATLGISYRWEAACAPWQPQSS